MIDRLVGLLHEHHALVAGCMWASGALLLAVLIVAPIVVARLPADYFAHQRRHALSRRTFWRGVGSAAKNVLGGVLVLAGVVMFIGPGQGSVAMLVGLMLMNFPGKYRLERWLARRPLVWATLSWLRRRTGAPPLLRPE